MKYFKNPKTEEELKNQYRQLLIKYDYRSEKNAPIIADIKKEYDMVQMQIKRANGYRTTTEKMVDSVREMHSNYVESTREEQQRISQLKNHKYTKSEVQLLIDDTKRGATKIIHNIIKNQKPIYPVFHEVVKNCDSEQVCRWFNTHAVEAVIKGLRMEYDGAREKLEYALKSQAKDKKSQESLMVQMEKMMGNHIVAVFNRYENELVDPIVVAELNTKKYQEKKRDKKFYNYIKNMCLIGWIIASVYSIYLGLTSTYMDISTSLISIPLTGVMVYLVYFLMVKVPQKVEKSLNKKTMAGIGYRKHNSRVSERAEYNENRARNGLITLVLRLLGL